MLTSSCFFVQLTQKSNDERIRLLEAALRTQTTNVAELNNKLLEKMQENMDLKETLERMGHTGNVGGGRGGRGGLFPKQGIARGASENSLMMSMA